MHSLWRLNLIWCSLHGHAPVGLRCKVGRNTNVFNVISGASVQLCWHLRTMPKMYTSSSYIRLVFFNITNFTPAHHGRNCILWQDGFFLTRSLIFSITFSPCNVKRDSQVKTFPNSDKGIFCTYIALTSIGNLMVITLCQQNVKRIDRLKWSC